MSDYARHLVVAYAAACAEGDMPLARDLLHKLHTLRHSPDEPLTETERVRHETPTVHAHYNPRTDSPTKGFNPGYGYY